MQISAENLQELDLRYVENRQIKKELEKLIQDYKPEKTESTDVTMRIILKDEEPVCQPPRRLAFTERQEVNKQIEEWLNEGIIRPSSSEYASPIVMVKKKDGSSKKCIDYRKLNQKLVKDNFPLPLIEDVLDILQEAKVYSTLDLRNGFFHVYVDEDFRKYTSFIVSDGQFEFNKVPFGLSTSRGVFQRYVSSIFRDFTRKGIVISYLDDLVIPAKNEQEDLEKLKIILDVAKKYGLEIKFKKCQFLKKKIEFLGHIVESGTIKPSPTKTLAVRKFPEPTTIKQVQSFLGLTGYFRNISEDYAKKELITRIARWELQLEEFYYEIEHRAGSLMKHVDALSRYPVMMRFSVHFKIIQRLLRCREHSTYLSLQIATGVPRGNGQVERIHRTLIPILTKLSLDDSTKWYKYVNRLQRILNSTICHSTKWTPFELLVGTKVRNKEDILIKDLLLEEIAKELIEQREFLRNDAKKNIETQQSENRKTYNRRRKKDSLYKEGDLVAIQRTQFGARLKLRPKFLGPYKVTKVNPMKWKRKTSKKISGKVPYRFVTSVYICRRWTFGAFKGTPWRPECRLGGVVGLSLALCTQGCGFDPGPSRWIFLMQKIDSGHVV
ncbi:retrovirus-related Pol polyprotein from transposon 17.6 [Trichonephila clavipes]|nr:retrovirus-related Pol polyprotein from transposon 17.6 [Trichonephila clavipes]